ncbi:trihelix protein [Artemisia annua]|uniref:Trihelix protein n=1 Tax=Artemisia annua TaxID=35608 RepID=A0A2U1QHY9_ARTAN|nr:trihelix protein [Artemisia annua]
MSTTVATVKPTRKFPPPCWTRDEALVLIEAYRERWYALHRAFLRNPDWDAVAEKVTTACPDVTPPKTSAQCRHKMEKLRQRHRAEKQRAATFPGGRFFSSWFYFEAMETLENGPGSEPGSGPNDPNTNLGQPGLNPGRGIRFKPSGVATVKPTRKFPPPCWTRDEALVLIEAYRERWYALHRAFLRNPDWDAVAEKPSGVGNNLVTLAANNAYVNNWGNQEDGDDDGNYVIDGANPYKNSGYVGGIRAKPVIPVAARKVRKVDEEGEMWVKMPRDTNSYQGNTVNESYNPGLKQGMKRGETGIDEVVASIKMLGDGFMKMEKMKIDMAREIERMRMDSEMKRNQLILESQKQIVDAFVKGLIETRKRPRGETGADS